MILKFLCIEYSTVRPILGRKKTSVIFVIASEFTNVMHLITKQILDKIICHILLKSSFF